MALTYEDIETLPHRVPELNQLELPPEAWSTFRPMRLTPFEWYMLDGGGQRAPMTFTIRLMFQGTVVPNAFAASVCHTLQRHLLLRAHVSGTRAFNWVPAKDPVPYMDFGEITEPVQFPAGEEIDLRGETGLRVWVRAGDERTEIYFQFHHACCDGIGAYRVIEDILCRYDLIVNGDASEAALRPLESARLQQRSRIKLERPAIAHRESGDRLQLLEKTAGFFFKQPDGVHSSLRSPVGRRQDETVCSFATHTFTAAQTRKLRSVASKAGGSSNDLLMRDLFVAIEAWNAGRPDKDQTGMLRIMLPVTQRTPEEDELFPACNRVSMVKIDRDRDALADSDELLSGIIREIRQIRALKRDLTFHRVAGVICAVPLLRWYMRRRAHRRYATTVLSQTGNVFSRAKLPRRRGVLYSGGMALVAVDGAPPVNPNTPVSFASIWYAKKLTITMSFDRSRFTQPEADALLATYVLRIQSSLDSVTDVEDESIADAA